MASTAYLQTLEPLLLDAEEILTAHHNLRTRRRGRQWGLGGLNRSLVVVCVSAWEAYVEEVVRECVQVLRPAPGVGLGAWPALNAYASSRIKNFNNPSVEKVRSIIASTVGPADITTAWAWRNCSPAHARQLLTQAVDFRHQIAHGQTPRPPIHNSYSKRLPAFFRRLGRLTDSRLSAHLQATNGTPPPWP